MISFALIRFLLDAFSRNQDQYKFIYDTLEEFLFSGYSFFPVSELSQRLKQKSIKIDGNKNEYQLEFEVRNPFLFPF